MTITEQELRNHFGRKPDDEINLTPSERAFYRGFVKPDHRNLPDRLDFKSAGAVPPQFRERRPLDETRYSDGPRQDDGSPFMKFWKLLNDLMESRGQPELLYLEAKGWYCRQEGGL